MSIDPTIHIRLKRQKQTFFISTTLSKTIFTIKEEVAKALSEEVSPRKMRIFLSKNSAPLQDASALSDHDSIQNDSVLYIVFRKKGREDEVIDAYDNESDFWESIDIIEDD